MIAAVSCSDTVSKGDDLLIIGILEESKDDFHFDSAFDAFKVHRLCQRSLLEDMSVVVFDKTVLVVERVLSIGALIFEMEDDAFCKAGLIIEMVGDAVIVEGDVFKDRIIRIEANIRSPLGSLS